jgi:hypothetical protein
MYLVCSVQRLKAFQTTLFFGDLGVSAVILRFP